MRRGHRRRRFGSGGAAVLVAVVAALGIPAAAQAGGGRGLQIRTHVTDADTVGVVVEVGASRHEECRGGVSEDDREEQLPSVRTGELGGARWSWFVPGNVDAAKWRVSVACGQGEGVRRKSKSFLVDAGSGRKSRGLWIAGTMHARAAQLGAPRGGNGGGGEPLYPIGQCTWWVAKRRPDLPYFAAESGDARNWARSAAARGFPVGTTPRVGAVAVFAPDQYGAGRYGHVAYVTAVSGAEMTISEDNFRGDRKPGERTIPFEGLRFIYRKGESTTTIGPLPHVGEMPPVTIAEPPPASTKIELQGLIEDTPVAGQVALSAVSDASGVRFSVYYFTELASPESARSVLIGEDQTPADGFTTNWNTTTVPNQGGPGGHTVMVTATGLDSAGEPDGASSTVRVEVANSRTEGSVTWWPYYVVGTCEDDDCEEGVHLRSGPGYSEFAETGHRHDGEEVDVVCQEVGEPFTSPRSG